MASNKELRRRIKSIRSTRQITRAMELVSAAKMRKAQIAALASRTYAKLAWELIQNLTPKIHPKLHRLLRRPEKVNKVGILLITSNRGLIGGFNSNIINKAVEYASSPPAPLPTGEGGRRPGEGVEFITIGKKGRDAVRKRGFTIAAEFEKTDTLSGVAEFLPVARLLVKDFVEGVYDKVLVIYMDFVSTLVQKPHVRELLPFIPTADETLGAVGKVSNAPRPPLKVRGGEGGVIDYVFEPTPDEVVEKLLPRLTELQIYQAYLETDAAEHSARMVAMKNASDAARDLIDELNLDYNKERQAAITREISEIVAGKLALGQN
ncbi:MAG: ATP synthase F1 subunit gamma [bacterium]|nr:ATP synthase F1 subunit gamma [bacterium]